MDDSEPWRNRRPVKVVAIVDIIIASIFIVLYFYYGIIFMTGAADFRGGMPVASVRLLSFLFALVAISTDILQAFFAAKLFQALKPDEPSAQDCIRKGKHWFKASVFFIILIFIKLLILLLIDVEVNVAFDFVFCFLELLLRVVGLYLVKELMDDLKAEASRGMPRSISVVVMADLLKAAAQLEQQEGLHN